jgi:HK97 family phage major capsid protein/HK97 family phage prohead protease
MDHIDIEVKFATDGAGLITGYASVFEGEPDSYGDIVAKGAFTKSLAEHKSAASSPLLLWQHDPSEPIGVWLELREDATGLLVTGHLILDTRRGQEAYSLLKAGALNGLSIGYRPRSSERRAGGGRILRDLELIEISLVSIPAASRARVTSVKTAEAAQPAAMGAAIERSHIMAVEKKAPAPDAGTEGDDVETRVAALEETVAGMDTRLKSVEESVGNVAKSAERIEQKLNRPGATVETKAAPEKIEAKAFTGFLRQGREALPADEVKSLRVADDTAGGYLAPDDFVAQVIKGIVEVSPVRQAAKVGSTSSGAVILPKRTGRPTASWVGETEDRPETGSTYGQVEIPVHEMACYVDVSLRLLEDAAVNIQSEVSSDLAEEFGRLEGAALVNGNGVKKPVGFMTDAGVAYTPTGNASTLGTAPADTLITMMYAMPAFYRNSGAWMMNGNTLAAIRKLKDGQGNFLWQPSYQAGQPETILGRPVIEAPDMDDVGSAAEPIAFGDFARAYRIYDRVALSVMRDPYSQATNGLVRFHARRRMGGGVVLAEAIRKLRCATS